MTTSGQQIDVWMFLFYLPYLPTNTKKYPTAAHYSPSTGSTQAGHLLSPAGFALFHSRVYTGRLVSQRLDVFVVGSRINAGIAIGPALASQFQDARAQAAQERAVMR